MNMAVPACVGWAAAVQRTFPGATRCSPARAPRSEKECPLVREQCAVARRALSCRGLPAACGRCATEQLGIALVPYRDPGEEDQRLVGHSTLQRIFGSGKQVAV